MNNAQTEFPRLIKIPVWGQSACLSRTQSYAVAEKFPPGVVVRAKAARLLRQCSSEANAAAEWLLERIGNEGVSRPPERA